MAHVHQISISDGGVPKLPVATAKVGVDGMMGDNQADKKHHGGPRQTLCLYSMDVIEELRNEGHPILPGYAGENITLAGVDWPSIQSGDRFRVGDDLIVEFTDPATPCSKNAGWFLDRNFKRMSHTAHPGSSRWYAIVVNPGEIATGDTVEKLAD